MNMDDPKNREDKVYHFVVLGKPWVQKNRPEIHYRDPKSRRGAFVAHSDEMERARDHLSQVFYRSFMAQGGRDPLDYFIAADLVFYCLRAHEPDLDNLPAIVFDALQGMSVKGAKGLKVAVVLKNDRLVREINSKKIVQGDEDYVGEPRTELTIRRYTGGPRDHG